jgi:hypothetical protein
MMGWLEPHLSSTTKQCPAASACVSTNTHTSRTDTRQIISRMQRHMQAIIAALIKIVGMSFIALSDAFANGPNAAVQML